MHLTFRSIDSSHGIGGIVQSGQPSFYTPPPSPTFGWTGHCTGPRFAQTNSVVKSPRGRSAAGLSHELISKLPSNNNNNNNRDKVIDTRRHLRERYLRKGREVVRSRR